MIMVCGGIILTIAMGIRHTFGLYLQPIVLDRGWSREAFAFAMALQNVMWGATQPFIGYLADRTGAFRVMLAGCVLYALGLILMTQTANATLFALAAGVLIGVAQSCVTYSVVYGVIGRTFPPEKRSQALGVGAAAGSFGQFIMIPVAQYLIGSVGWQTALLICAGLAAMMLPLAWGFRRDRLTEGGPAMAAQSLKEALSEAFRNRSFLLLTAGYFVCGFQVVFIGVHFPAYLKDHGAAPQLAVAAMALIGLFNIIGTYSAGQLGARYPKRYLLSTIYILRSVVIVLFLLAPLTSWSVYLFAAAIGLLWLSTVPLTNGLVAQIFGVQYMSMLSGFVFFSHQVGSFLGAWLGGLLYDRSGNYNTVWGICIALGVFAALINWPIKEEPLARLTPQAA